MNKIISVAVILTLSLGLTACFGSDDSSTPPEDVGINIGVGKEKASDSKNVDVNIGVGEKETSKSEDVGININVKKATN